MYRARIRFADLQDGNHIYEAGEQYPRPGLDVTNERIAELAGKSNAMGYPLIEAVEVPSDAVERGDKEIPIQPQEHGQSGRRSRQKE